VDMLDLSADTVDLSIRVLVSENNEIKHPLYIIMGRFNISKSSIHL